MADFKDTREAEASERENQVWKLRVKGYNQQEIADELGITQAAVCYILKRTSKKFHDTFMENINDYKMEQAKWFFEVGLEALKQYQESKKPQKSVEHSGVTKEKIVKSKKIRDFDGKVITTIKTVDQFGDVKFLQVFFKCMEEIRKLFGMEGSLAGDNRLSAMSTEEIIKSFESLPIEKRIELVSNMVTKK